MKKLLIIFFATYFSCQPSFAGIFVNLGLAQANLKEKDYIFLEKPVLPFFNIGYSYKFDNIILAAQTNRLLNIKTNQKVIYKGLEANLETKAISDTFSSGYQINKFVPSVFASNVNSKKHLTIGTNVYEKNTQSIVLGASLNYFINKNIAVSFFITAPNKPLSLTTYSGFGFNYFF